MPKKTLHTIGELESSKDFEAAYRDYQQNIYRFLLWRTRDKELAEDLTSGVFQKAWQSRHSFQGGSVQAWLYRIARNSLTDYWRKKKEVLSDEVDTQIDDKPSHEEAMDTMLSKERLHAAIEGLPENMRQIVVLRFIDGRSSADVAKKLGTSEGNVRIIQYRALKKLREYLS